MFYRNLARKVKIAIFNPMFGLMLMFILPKWDLAGRSKCAQNETKMTTLNNPNINVRETAQRISLTRDRISQNLCTRLQLLLVLKVSFYNPLLQVCLDFWSKRLSDVVKKFDIWL